MRKKKSTKQQGKNYQLLTIFIIVVGVFLLVGIILKAAVIVAKSRFDNYHRFTLLINQSPTKSEVISFSPEDKSISAIMLTNKNVANTGKELEVPIDASISGMPIDSQKNISLQLIKLITRLGFIHTNLTLYDIIRLALFANSVTPDKISSSQLDLPLSTDSIDKNSSVYFKETTINSENISIQIVNATGESGIGNRLARLLTNIGGNVVLVKTGDSLVMNSVITYANGEKSYTLKRLTTILGYPANKMQNTAISDIIIMLGKDAIATNVF